MRIVMGQQLGNYFIIERLGGGAMGEVFRAQAPDETDVAVKVLHQEFSEDLEFRARFERELKLLQSLDHPNIVKLLDFGAADGYLFFVMTLVEGATLARVMRQRRFSPLAVWSILEPLVSALDYGHRLGILHRDIKPGNVLVGREQGETSIFLMDFGLGKQPGTDITLTETGISIGTPAYMSPEAALGRDIDHRADVYSLAMMTHELLLGAVPFDYPEPHMTAIAQVNDTPPPMTFFKADFPPALEAVILRSFAKNPADRHQNVVAFAEDYYQALQRLSPAQQETEYWV